MKLLLKNPKGRIELTTPIYKEPEANVKRIIPNASGYYVKYYNDISIYRINKYEADKDGNVWFKDYPKLSCSEDGENYQDWLFFGWYQDEECKTAINKDTVSGSAFAKFYPISVSTVRGNADINESIDSTSSLYRILARTPTLDLHKIGANITLPTGKTNENSTTSVLESLVFEQGENKY
jgi:hypothetical protein